VQFCLFSLLCFWKKKDKLAKQEREEIVKAVNNIRVKSLLFTGGEPSLYISDINQILAKLKNPKKIKVKITTNGGFARTQESAKRILCSFLRLNGVQLSYDKYHRQFLPFQNIGILYRVCKELNLTFSVIMAIQSPMDMVLVKQLRQIGKFQVKIINTLPMGSAKKNDTYYSYLGFNDGVLSGYCPRKNKISYWCGQGFSICCSLLTEGDDWRKYAHPTLEEHINSSFYKLLTKYNFRQLFKKLKVSTKGLLPEHSSPCVLCKYLFDKYYDKNVKC